ncbi:MAG: protein-export chaperone SecB [Proteobacteria bacterium]|jgi:preprotein translocase subunit SecB|nr:protein-export chaperone SecB [Pseudomonadota bacterium]
MTEENQTKPETDEAAADQQVQLRIEKVYLKDVSFESPKSPEVFTRQWQPNLSVDINTRATPLPDDRHEVILSITVRAQVDEDFLGFLVEVQQAGIFYIKNADPAQVSQIVGIACPTTLFPYARESVDSLVVKGGFPPIQLAQVNFEALYVKALQERQQKSQEQGAEKTTH